MFLFVNLLLSGVIDWVNGMPVRFPFAPPFNGWHKVSGLAFAAYAVVHVWKRRRRIRRSFVR